MPQLHYREKSYLLLPVNVHARQYFIVVSYQGLIHAFSLGENVPVDFEARGRWKKNYCLRCDLTSSGLDGLLHRLLDELYTG